MIIARLTKSSIRSRAALATAVILAMGIAYAEDYNSSTAWETKPQKVILEDSAISPDGKWVVERYSEIFQNDSATGISLHHTGEIPPSIPIFIPYKSINAGARFKWLDDSTLLIAVEEGVRLETTPDEYYGVHLRYDHYPSDPDAARIEGKQKIYTKTIEFSYDYEKEKGIGLPNIGCTLKMIAADGDYLNSPQLIISAAKEYPHGEWQHPPKNVFGVLIPTPENNAIKPLSYETGVKLQDFSPKDKYLKRGKQLMKAPLGNFELDSQDDFLSLMHKLKSGDLHIKVGFWFDNVEVVYTNAVPKDLTNIEAFEQCIKQNNIISNINVKK